MSCSIHKTAIIENGAEIGEGVEVGAYSVIGSNVKIGDKCKIGPHAVIEGDTTIGEETRVFQFASIGADPQDLSYRGEKTELIIGSRNKIREFVTLQPGTNKGTKKTIIGDGNLFMANCHVGHDCRVGNNNVFANSAGLAGHVTIFNNTVVGGLVGIHQFTRIGDFSMLSAGSMVGQDVPPFSIAQGDRCRLRGINVIGLQRANFASEEISAIKKAYRVLFSAPGNIKEKEAQLDDSLLEFASVRHMVEFTKETERGVTTAS